MKVALEPAATSPTREMPESLMGTAPMLQVMLGVRISRTGPRPPTLRTMEGASRVKLGVARGRNPVYVLVLRMWYLTYLVFGEGM